MPAQNIESDSFHWDHDALHRACGKEQRRRMLDYYGPEREKRANAHHLASILRVPFRSFHENFGYDEPVDVQYLAQVDAEYAQATKAENEERDRRITEFQTLDVELAYSIATLIRALPIYKPEISPDITIDTERSIIAGMRKVKRDLEEENPIKHKEVKIGWFAIAMNKISDVVKSVLPHPSAAVAATGSAAK